MTAFIFFVINSSLYALFYALIIFYVSFHVIIDLKGGERMNLIPVVSSNVSSIGYENGVIEVHFHNGYAYRYPNCTEQLFNDFLNAPSKGHFVHAFLKGRGEIRIR